MGENYQKLSCSEQQFYSSLLYITTLLPIASFTESQSVMHLVLSIVHYRKSTSNDFFFKLQFHFFLLVIYCKPCTVQSINPIMTSMKLNMFTTVRQITLLHSFYKTHINLYLLISTFFFK